MRPVRSIDTAVPQLRHVTCPACDAVITAITVSANAANLAAHWTWCHAPASPRTGTE